MCPLKLQYVQHFPRAWQFGVLETWPCRPHALHMPDTCWRGPAGHMRYTCRTLVGAALQATCVTHAGHLLARPCRPHALHMPDTCWRGPAGHMRYTCGTLVGAALQATCVTHAGHLLARPCRPHALHMRTLVGAAAEEDELSCLHEYLEVLDFQLQLMAAGACEFFPAPDDYFQIGLQSWKTCTWLGHCWFPFCGHFSRASARVTFLVSRSFSLRSLSIAVHRCQGHVLGL